MTQPLISTTDRLFERKRVKAESNPVLIEIPLWNEFKHETANNRNELKGNKNFASLDWGGLEISQRETPTL